MRERKRVRHPSGHKSEDQGHRAGFTLHGGADCERELTARPELRCPGGLIHGRDEACGSEFRIEDAASVSSDELAIRRNGRHHERLEGDRRFQPQSLDQRCGPDQHFRSVSSAPVAVPQMGVALGAPPAQM